MRLTTFERGILCASLLGMSLTAVPARAQQDIISTVVGGGPSDMPAVDADINAPYAVTLDAAGNYYIAAYGQNRVYKVNSSGLLTVVAGNGLPGYSGDGIAGGAVNAMLSGPQGVAADSLGNIYIADSNNSVIRKVDTTSTITTVAGQASVGCAYNGNGTPATNYDLCYPANLAVDSSNNLYIADSSNCLVRKLVPSTSTISNYAGTANSCSYGGDGGLATSAKLYYPSGVALDSAGNLYIADTYNYRIRKVTLSSGKISTIAGTGTPGYTGDGGPATSAQIDSVYAVAVNTAGTLVTIPDANYEVIRQFTVGGNINTIAGGGYGYCGDGGPALGACLSYPQAVAVSATTVYVADTDNERIRAFTPGGNISTVAGNGSASMATPVTGVAPQGVVLNYPWGVLKDSSSNIFVADQNNCMVRELVNSADLVNFFAGDGTCGFAGDGGSAIQAELYYPYGVTEDSAGNVYIADTYNCVVRQVNTSGVINTFAGSPLGQCGYSGDGGPATSAFLSSPAGLSVDAQNNLYIADSGNSVIRKVSGGIITTIAGDGARGFAGDGGPAQAAELDNPYGVGLDGAGNIYIADTYNQRIRMVAAATGNISTIAGNGTAGFSGDGIATQNSLYYPSDVKADVNGNVFIADTGNNRLRWVTPGGILTTFAGTGTESYNGDGELGLNADISQPAGIFVDSSGNILASDQYNYRVREISAFGGLGASVSNIVFGVVADKGSSPPQAVTLSAVGPVTITNIAASSQFSESDNCPASMTNGQKCTVYVYFKPTGSGVVNGTLTVDNTGFFSTATTVTLQGTGTSISITGGPVAFGNQLVKTTSAAKSVTISNKGKSAITMGAITLTETTDFAISSNKCPASGSTLAANASCTVSLTFTPQSTGAKKGALLINDSDPTSPQLVGITGTGTSNITFSPSSVSFAAQAIGTTSAATKVTLTNTTGVTVNLGSPAITVSGPFLTTSATTCTNGLPVANNGTCVIYVEFAPTAAGYVTGTLSVSDSDATSPQTVALSGTGASLQITPAALNVGSASVGTTIDGTLTLKNLGSEAITFVGATVTGTNAADFNVRGEEPICGGSLAAGATCTVYVYFTPSIIGSESATLSFYDSSPVNPQTVKLSGTGTH